MTVLKFLWIIKTFNLAHLERVDKLVETKIWAVCICVCVCARGSTCEMGDAQQNL